MGGVRTLKWEGFRNWWGGGEGFRHWRGKGWTSGRRVRHKRREGFAR